MLQTTVKQLTPFTQYQFSIKACNAIGCTAHSFKVTTQTTAAAPENQSPPQAFAITSTSISLKWVLPQTLNGPALLRYIVERTNPVFHEPPMQVSAGVRFPGFGYYQLNKNFIPDSATTEIEFEFKTKYSSGLLFFASSDGQEDLLAIEFREGRPWFMFDTESGPTVFTVSQNMTFHDGNWHSVRLTRNMRDGEIVIDEFFKGSGSGTGSANVIGQISKVFVGGLPSNFSIIRKDSGIYTLNRHPYIGCIRNFKYKGVAVNFTGKPL